MPSLGTWAPVHPSVLERWESLLAFASHGVEKERGFSRKPEVKGYEEPLSPCS